MAKLPEGKNVWNRLRTQSRASVFHPFGMPADKKEEKEKRVGTAHMAVAIAGYSEEELSEYKEVFSLFDKDGSGSIGYSEMETAMMSLGVKASAKEIEDLIREVDVDGNGEIDFEEFCLVMRKLSNKKDSEAETIRQCFDVFDQDCDGIVSETEFRHVFEEIGGFNQREIDDIFKEADVCSNGRLDYDEFTQMVRTYLFDEDS